ncbi:MAG: hypothetical protein ILO42_02705, partial [Clostridia bacterium]|nr:hypothetical protein [Clostridia bacterium]
MKTGFRNIIILSLTAAAALLLLAAAACGFPADAPENTSASGTGTNAPPVGTTVAPDVTEPPESTSGTQSGTALPDATSDVTPDATEPEQSTENPPATSDHGEATSGPETTTVPDETTAQPPETTEPEVTTAQPPVTTEPEVTTSQPPVTTEPEVTTAQPPETTEPEATTAQSPETTEPEATTAQPPETTEPEVTTAEAPETTEPEATTAEAPETTEPEVTTAQPPETAEPEVTTEQPPVTTEPEITTEHVHVFGDWFDVTPAGCVTSGVRRRECACGEYLEEPTNPLGHFEVADPAAAPGCTTPGMTAGSHCGRCGTVIIAQQTIAPAHTPVVTNPAVLATARSCGRSAEVSCSVCGNVITASTITLPTGLEDPDLYSSDYAYQFLATLTGGDNMQALYRLIDEKARIFHRDGADAGRTLEHNGQSIDEIRLGDDTYFDASPYAAAVEATAVGLDSAQVYTVWAAYKADHPLYYWIANSALSFPLPESKTLLLVLCDADYASGSVRSAFNSDIYEKVGELLASSAKAGGVYAEAAILHDAIATLIDYRYNGAGQPDDSPEAHSIAGFFTLRGGVCECYAKTFQMLLNFRGIENVYVYTIDHAFNLVKADDGAWYWVDVTYDDQPSFDKPLRYCFFKNDTEDIYSSSGLVGNGTFLDMQGHEILEPGGPDYV